MEELEYFAFLRKQQARQSLQRRGIDPEDAAREGRRNSFDRLFARYVRERRPSRKFRRIVRGLLLVGWGPYPLRYLRSVEFVEAMGFISRSWQRKFPAEPLEEFEAELAGFQGYRRTR